LSKELYNIIGKVFSISADDIDDESSPENIESWDSFNGLVLVDELENHFNVKFTLSEIAGVKNVSDIKKYLKSHGVELNE
jgi:acyl carrier protein